jgi:myo-inositol-1(or 4)-monophosphatase
MTSQNPTRKELLAVAEEAARAAGAVALRGFRTPLEVRSKGGSDIVTQYDNAAEEVAIATVRTHFPTHSFLAEESGSSDISQDAGSAVDALPDGDLAHKAFRWLIDPIDGTHNYAAQIPFWCVSVAVVDLATNTILVGVVYDPLHQELFAATLGKSATLNGEPIGVATKSDVAKAIVAYDIGHSPGIAHQMVDMVAWVQPRVAKVRHLGSAALSITYVAAGRLDAYYHLSLQPWDIAAALLLVQEAGGMVTDWAGEPRNSGAGSAVAAGKLLHPALLKLLHAGSGNLKDAAK